MEWNELPKVNIMLKNTVERFNNPKKETDCKNKMQTIKKFEDYCKRTITSKKKNSLYFTIELKLYLNCKSILRQTFLLRIKTLLE